MATHETSLLSEFQDADVLVLRECLFQDNRANAWDAQIVSQTSQVEGIREAIRGARRKLLFVEGTEQSLDKSIYGLLYPDVAIVSKGSCIEVERSVKALRGLRDQHWVEAFGIVDRDHRDDNEGERVEG